LSQPASPHSDALRIEALRFRYAPRGEWTVNIPLLAMTRGEQLLMAGGSGRGKSTLLHLIAGLMEPGEGRVMVAGQDVHALSGAARDLFRGRNVGMIFQTFNLLHGFTALENVMAALMFSGIAPSEHRGKAAALLSRLGIERADAMTDELSVGQQQRVAVARAVVCDPVLVLADEPTASLDPDNAEGAMDLIQQVCREKNAALLCVSHDPAMEERFPKHARLDDLASQEAVNG